MKRTLRWVGVGTPIVLPCAVLLVFVMRGCATASVPLLHPPPGVTLPPAAATSVPEDLTGIQLAGVDGTTTLVPIPATGTSHLSGSVNGPQGPVPGAVVRVEHLVDNNPAPIDVLTGADGRWDLPNIAGGRYRVRAFLPPSLAQTTPEIFFLNEGEQHNVDLAVDSFTDAALAAAVAPDPPVLNQSVTLVVRVARKTVDGNGVVRGDPIVSAAVALTGTPGWTVQGSSSATSDVNGDARFTLQCRAAGASQVQVTVKPTPADQPQQATLEVSACVNPAAPPSSSSSSSSGGATTTTAPPTTTGGTQPN